MDMKTYRKFEISFGKITFKKIWSRYREKEKNTLMKYIHIYITEMKE